MRRLTMAVCLMGTAALVASPLEAEERVLMSFPRFQEATHAIDQVDTQTRTATVSRREVPFYVPAWEGPAVLLLSSTKLDLPDMLVRVEVTEVLDEGRLRISYGPEAAAVIRPGKASLARPFAGDFGGQLPTAAATKQIRGLPEVVRLTGDDGSAGGDLFDAMTAARAAARRVASMNNLKQIGLAFHNYADVHGAFPPAVILGPDGTPWHSWRVLLLPYLEQQALYNAYDFSKPWNAAENRAVTETLVAIYRDPARDGNDALTDYAAIVGESAIFMPNLVKMQSADDFPACLQQAKVSFSQVTDGTSNTIMFASLDPSRKVPWTKPEDIVVGEDFPGVGKPAGIGGSHPGAEPGTTLALVAFTDGSVRVIPGSLDGTTIMPFLTRNGGEVVDDDVLSVKGVDPGNRPRQPAVRILETADGSVRFSLF
jgi:hypothetical protein